MSYKRPVGEGPDQPVENFAGPSFDSVRASHLGMSFCPTSHDAGRQRDLLPLPLLPDHLTSPKVNLHDSSSRSRRNTARRAHHACQVNDAIKAINMLAGHKVSAHGEPSEAQREAQFNLLKQVSRSPKSASFVQQQEAVHELLRVSLSSYQCEDEARSTVRSYDKGLTSLPECGAQVFEASELLDEVGRDILQDPREHLFMPDATIDKKVKPYMDEILKNDAEVYHDFIFDLWQRGMITFGQVKKSIITPFFVIKKNQRLRLVLDCRATNQLFRPPPDIAMAAGYSFGQLELSSKDTMYVAQSDIKDYFYSIGLPSYLYPFFSLPPIRPGKLRDRIPDLQGMAESDTIFPQMRVVPMGWNWAMYFAQRIHQHQVMIGAGLEATQILADGRPPPDLCSGTTVVIPYADNLNVVGIDQKEVQRVKDAAVSQLRSVGFRVHEEEDAKSSAKALGFILDGVGGRVHPIPEKRDKIILALKWLAKRPRITGRSLERIIGHCIHLFMLRREFLSIFRSVYDFKTANLHRRARLWKSAAAECEWASHLLVLCESDLRKPWSGHITVSDACLSGTATCAMETDPRVVQQVGQGRELWRFRSSLPSKKARDTVLALDPFKDLETALPWDAVYDPFQLNHEFQNVPREIALSADCKVMFSSRMYLKEAITVLEGRATLQSIRHKSRSIRHFGCKHLHLGDNLGMVLAFDRGRAKAIPLLFCCRRALAYSLACGTQFVHRWIPSEFNAADSPSRQWEGEGSQKTPYEESQKAKKRFVTEILYPNASRKTASDIFEKDLQEFSSCHLKPTAFYPGSESCRGSGEPKTLGEIDVKHSEGSQGQRHGGPDGKEGKASEHTEPHLEISGADHLGGNGRISGNCFGLCTKSSCVSKLLQNTSSPGSHCHTGRFSPDYIPQRVFSRGHGHSGRSEVSSCSHGSMAHCRKNRLRPKQKSLEGLEEFRPRIHKASTGLACHQPHSSDPDAAEQCSGRPTGAHHVCHLHSAKRGIQVDGPGPDSVSRAGSSVCNQPERSRRAGDFKSGHVRRSYSTGLQNRQLSRECSPKTGQGKAPQIPSLCSDLPPARSAVETSPSDLEAGRELCGAVPTSSLRGFLGCPPKAPKPAGNQVERALVSRLKPQEVRVPCQGGTNVRKAAVSGEEASNGISSVASGNGYRVFYPKRHNGLKPALELFAGCAAFSKALCSHGFVVYAYDIDWGANGDLLKPAFFHQLMHDIHQQRFSFVHFGMPSESWSTARKWDGGPPPLRDDGPNLYGFTNRPLADLLKIKKGNDLLKHTVTLALQCIKSGIAWTIENPLTSRAWETEEMLLLIKRGASPQHVHFCQYNKPWRKATTFLGWKVPSFNFRLCKGSHRVCSATGLRHTILQGRNKAGVFRTLIAQPYPRALVLSMASSLSKAL